MALTELAELGYTGAQQRDPTAATFRSQQGVARTATLLGRARLAVAFHLVLDFAVPRPKALLGDQHLRRLLAACRAVIANGGHQGFRLSAAGSDSAVFRRLAEEIARGTGLQQDDSDGELLIRVRRVGRDWQVLLRLTPRPLSARSWRVCNLDGGLNATIAAAMNRLLLEGRDPAGSYLNLMCGSGTLLAEWSATGGRGPQLGLDLSQDALECARQNLAGTGASLQLADATSVPLADASQDFIACDPPWGDDIGDHEGNRLLYPRFISEAARLLRPGGRLALISHELKLTEKVLAEQAELTVSRHMRVWHGGHRPVIWLLEKP